jgi:hypothetical protein
MFRSRRLLGIVFFCGLVCGAALWSVFDGSMHRAARAADEKPATAAPTDAELLRAEMSMFMADYHASNLWFAARSENWPLAAYYWDKVMLHMKSSAAVDPTRKADLEAIMAAIDRSPVMNVDEAIEKKDIRAFGEAYRNALQGCYNCHKVAGMDYLRPRFPVPPSSAIINVDPKAEWPK